MAARFTPPSPWKKRLTRRLRRKPRRRPKEPLVCFESRKGASEVTQREIKPGWPNVKCSPTTGAALWYGDPFDGTVPMGKMPGLENLPEGHGRREAALGEAGHPADVRHRLP